MDFEEILERWEQKRDRQHGEGELLRGRDTTGGESDTDDPAGLRRRLRTMIHQDVLDLHGVTVKEALSEIDRFVERSKAAGYEKVLIIHGKGKHGNGDGILRSAVRKHLSGSRDTGEMTIPPERYGGAGAVWVVIRQRSR